MGRELKFSYHILQHGWNAYLRMLDADYVCNFTCPICKNSPETLVLDGITMGTVKELPESSHDCDENQKYTLVPISKSVFNSKLKTRKSLKSYCTDGLLEGTFSILIRSIELKGLKIISFIQIKYQGMFVQ